MNPLRKLLNPTAAPTRTIIFTRSCSAGGKGWQPGDKGSFSERVAADLIGSGAGYDPTAADTAEITAKQLDELLPAPVAPEALPESWESLPAPFAEYHKLNAAYRALRKREDSIWNVLLPRIQGYMVDADVRSIEILPGHTRRTVLGAFAGRVQVGTPDERETSEQNFLKDAYTRALKACTDWKDANGDEAFRTRILCGDTVQDVHEKLCTSIRELHETGLEIFTLRIAMLGLSGRKVTELYSGSADAEKYSCFNSPSIPHMRLAYYEEGVGGRSYCDHPVTTLVSYYRKFSGSLEEVTATLAQAKKELAKATKISAAA